ncbi:MAG: cache domain-containing protein, partial [Candidatus Hydrogenedentota bacterium]
MKQNAWFVVLRTLLPAVLTLGLFVTAFYVLLLPMMREQALDQQRNEVRALTEVVVSMLAEYHAQVLEGGLSLDKAQDRAARRVRQLRYGTESKDYFWVV